MVVLLFGLLTATNMAAVDQAIVEMIKDAIATNAALVRSGTTNFDVSQTVIGSRPTRVKGTFSWRGNDGLWTFRLTDPESFATGRGTYSQDIAEAPVEFMLLSGNKLYSYDAKSNSLHLYEFKGRNQALSSFFLFDLFPTTLWERCCPPLRGEGRSWTEMIGPNSPASQANSTHELTRISPTVYRHIRVDPDTGTLRSDYSLDFAGYVIANDYDCLPQQGRSTHVRYQWQRIGRAVVLKHCDTKRMSPDDPNRVEAVYTAQFDQTDVATPVPSSKFSFDDFIKLLPRNTMVNNHITNKTYPLHKSSGLPDELLQELVKKARSGGLSKEAKP